MLDVLERLIDMASLGDRDHRVIVIRELVSELVGVSHELKPPP